MQFLQRMEHLHALDSEQRGEDHEVSATTGSQSEAVDSSGELWPWIGGGTGATSGAASHKTHERGWSQANSKWPDLPDAPRESIESSQFLRGMEHIQALDLEQRGAS
jgi:hypothetical protein